MPLRNVIPMKDSCKKQPVRLGMFLNGYKTIKLLTNVLLNSAYSNVAIKSAKGGW